MFAGWTPLHQNQLDLISICDNETRLAHCTHVSESKDGQRRTIESDTSVLGFDQMHVRVEKKTYSGVVGIKENDAALKETR